MTDVMHMSEIRDVRLAQEFAQMTAQGYLDREFTMYGCAYWAGGERHYRVSSHVEKINDFIEQSGLRGLYPTPLMTLTKVCPVPLGQQEQIAKDLKVQLARQLQEGYPEGFFELLGTIAHLPGSDGAKPILAGLTVALAGSFSEEKLGLFEGLVQLAYEAKVLSESSYEAFALWLRDERSNMAEDLVVKDLFERTFYGMAYEDKTGAIKYLSNACKDNIQGKKRAYQQEGRLTTPIFGKTYWYNYTYRLPQAQEDYKGHLQVVLDTAYLEVVRSIQALPTTLDQGMFQEQVATCRENFGDLAAWALRYYGRKWHLFC